MFFDSASTLRYLPAGRKIKPLLLNLYLNNAFTRPREAGEAAVKAGQWTW
jgi:hypothetical protein